MSPPGYQRLLAELKRRQVFRVAAVYGATAFVILQVAELLVGTFQLPIWVQTTVGVLLVVGFPIAVIVSWAFELTPGGLQRTDAAQPGEISAIVAEPAVRRWASGLMGLAGIVMLTIGVGLTVRSLSVRPDAAEVEAIAAPEVVNESIAVLPFVNMSDDPADAYFSDGLAEEILNLLTQTTDLKVTARTSSFALRDEAEDVRRIGEMLGVAHVLEGSVRRYEDRVRVTAQLISAADGFHLWSETYERGMEDVFAIQDQIAGSIAAALEAEISGDGAVGIEQRRTSDLEAYDLYLLGRHAWRSRTDEGIRIAIDYFERAIDADPEFALAYSGLADALNAYAWFVSERSVDVVDRARAAADRAVELAPGLAEGYASRGLLAMEFEWDPETAVRLLVRAIDLNPGYAPSYHWYADALTVQGRGEDAIAPSRKAIELDPLSFLGHWALGSALVSVGRLDEGILVHVRTAELAPGTADVQLSILQLLLYAERWDEARRAAEDAGRALGVADPSRLHAIVDGVRDRALAGPALELLGELERDGIIGGLTLASLYGSLDEMDRALGLIEAGYEARNPEILWIRVWPGDVKFRGQPRFEAIVEAIGVPTSAPDSAERKIDQEV